jgi:hypothetical protein
MHDTKTADTGSSGNIGGKKLWELRSMFALALLLDGYGTSANRYTGFYTNLMANEAYDKKTGELQNAKTENAVGKNKTGNASMKKVERGAVEKPASKEAQRKSLGKRKLKVTTYVEIE